MLKTKDGYAKVIGTSYLGSSDYLLLSNGDSKAISSLSVNYATNAGNADTLDGNHASAFAAVSHTHPYLPLSGAYITGTNIADMKVNIRNYFNGKPAGTNCYVGSPNIIYNFLNDSAACDANSVCGIMALNPGYDNYNHGHFLVSHYGDNRIGMIGLGYLTWYGPNWFAYTSDIPTVTDYYWANIKVSASSSTSTSPTFESLWINNSHFFKLSGTTFTCQGGTTFTLPSSSLNTNTALLWTTASDGTKDTGIFYNSSDFAFIANSNDHGAVFAVYDTDVTQDFEAGAREISVPGSGGALWARGGFSKSGSSNDYVLLGGGGHKALSDFSISKHTHSSITIPVCSSLDENSDVFRIEYAGGSNSVATKPSGVDAFGVIRLRTAAGWYGQIMMSANTAPGIYYRNANGLSSSVGWKKLLDSSNFNSYSPKLDGTGASGTWNISVTGNANTVDNIHATGFLRWKGMLNIGSNAPFQAVVDIIKDTSKLNDGGLSFYSYEGDEYTVLIGSRNDATRHGNALKWGYANKYLWMIRMINGSPKSSDWEKISAGYADSAGSVAWGNITGKPSSFTPSAHDHNYVLDIANNSHTTFAYSKSGLSKDSITWLAVWNGYELRAMNKDQVALSGHTHDDRYLKLTGGTMTGNISYKGSKNTYEMIRFVDNNVDVYGNGICIGGGGLTIIGGGDSASSILSKYTNGGEERMIIANDIAIDFFSNMNSGWDSRKAGSFDTSGYWNGVGFKKNNSNDNYVLTGGGGHKAISSLSVNHALFADYICNGTLPTPANNTVKAYKDSLAKFFNDIRPNGGVGANVNVSASIINNWSNDSATLYDSSAYCFIKIGGAYGGATYGQFLLSSYNLSQVGIVGRNNNTWSKIKWLAYEDQIPTDNKQLVNGAGYITSAGSCAYATSAGNADTTDGVHITWAGELTSTSHLVAWEANGSALRDINTANVTVGNSDKLDGYHASDLVKFYLSPMASDASADSAKSWFINTMPSASGAIVYNVPGSEKTIIAGKSSGEFGHMLQLNYDNKYLRILRYYNGSWKSTDWEKISAGYADSAGSVAWSNITDRPSSLKNPYSLNIFGVTYDGSAAKTVTTSTFVSLLGEGTSTVTDGTMFITSYASNSGFADTNAVNVPYKRKASCLWSYIDSKVSSKYLPLAGGTMNGNARIGHGSGNLYIGNSGNDGWIYTQDIASLKGTDKWSIRTSGAAQFGSLHIASKTDNSFNSSVIECSSTINLNYFSSLNVSLCNGGGTVQIGSYTTGDTGNNKLYVNGSEFINGASNVKNHVFADGFRHRGHNSDDAVLLAGGGYSQGVPVRYWAIYYMYIGNSSTDVTYTKRGGNYDFITSEAWESEGSARFDIRFPSGYNKNNTLIFGNGDHRTSSSWKTPVYVTITTSTSFGSEFQIRVMISDDASLNVGFANIYFMCMG